MALRTTIFTPLLAVCLAAAVLGEDWPVYRYDNHRGGTTPERITAESLSQRWAYRCSALPQPAWAGPAKWDAYHELRGLRSMRDYDMEGPLLASQTAIFVSQGRVAPLMLDRQGGQTLGSVKGGGSFALLTDDDHLLHGPGNKAGWITQSSTKTRQTLATFNGANAMVVSGSTAYILTDDRLFAIDRPTKKTLWETACGCPHELILAGDTLFAGGASGLLTLRHRQSYSDVLRSGGLAGAWRRLAG